MAPSFGKTWWSKKWLEALYNIDLNGRLARGKSYANTGHVKDLKIEGNIVTAKVKGSAKSPYKIVIKFNKLDETDIKLIIHEISYNRTLLSALLNGELPEEILEIFHKSRVKLFIDSWKDINSMCSCPDYAVPCKHIAAVAFLLSEEIDKNPALVFSLRGINLAKELKNRGIDITDGGQSGIPELSHIINYNDITVSQSQEPIMDLKSIPESGLQILSLLTDNPVFYRKENFKHKLEKLYDFIRKESNTEENTVNEEVHTQYNEYTSTVIRFDDALSLSDISISSKNHTLKISGIKEMDKMIEFVASIPYKTVNTLPEGLKFIYYSYLLAFRLAKTGCFIPSIYKYSATYYVLKYIPYTVPENVNKIINSMIAKFTTSPAEIYYPYSAENNIKKLHISTAFFMTVSAFIEHFARNFGIKSGVMEDSVAELFFRTFRFKIENFYDEETPNSIFKWLSRFRITTGDFIPVLKIDEANDNFSINYEIFIKQDAEYIPLKKVIYDDHYLNYRLDALKRFGLIREFFDEFKIITDSNGDKPLHLDSERFNEFFETVLPILNILGIELLLPRGLKEVITPSLKIKASSSSSSQSTGNQPSFTFNDVVNFDYTIALGDKNINIDEFFELVRDRSGLIKIKDQFIHIDRKTIEKLTKTVKDKINISPENALKSILEEDHKGVEIVPDATIINNLKQIIEEKEFPLPSGLNATLREYQVKGYSWLKRNYNLKIGCILADDMGLGKTIQTITFILSVKESDKLAKNKALIIVPTGLITNWEMEFAKFSPDLKISTFYGTNKEIAAEKFDVLITSYGMMRNNIDIISSLHWEVVVFDEAQNLKNPLTERTKAALKIKSAFKIALSGTPVENRLVEFWSIMNSVNKGYLGSIGDFKLKFANPIEREFDADRIEKFKRVTSPFFMRRVKTDKSIIKDLPEKIEIDEYTLLTKEQGKLYQEIIDNYMDKIHEKTGFERRGMIFKMITALKQICNHPANYLKNDDITPSISGKMTLLLELLYDIYESGNKVLIFTQFKEMGEILKQSIENTFKNSVLFIHGGLDRKERDSSVHDFQNGTTNSTMILTIKAGGTGLNLTAANFVIHFDLWWNPAVEAQATDRAYRIGQKKNVMVYRFITKGTFEEKIDSILKNKKTLSDLTVETGENWIADMDEDMLKEIFSINI